MTAAFAALGILASGCVKSQDPWYTAKGSVASVNGSYQVAAGSWVVFELHLFRGNFLRDDASENSLYLEIDPARVAPGQRLMFPSEGVRAYLEEEEGGVSPDAPEGSILIRDTAGGKIKADLNVRAGSWRFKGSLRFEPRRAPSAADGAAGAH